MPWTDITCREHTRRTARFPSDLTDEEWSVLSPLVPSARLGGRPRTTDMRDVLNAILYIAEGGIAWRMLPKDFPPVSSVRGYFYQWRSEGTLALMNFALVQLARDLEGSLAPVPVLSTAKALKPLKTVEFTAMMHARKSKARKRHIVPDTNGFMVGIIVHNAAIQDHDGAVSVLQLIRRFYPFLRHVFADGGYAGDKLKCALKAKGNWTIEVIRRSDDPTTTKASRSYHGVGWWNAHSHGSEDATGWQKTVKRQPKAQLHGR